MDLEAKVWGQRRDKPQHRRPRPCISCRPYQRLSAGCGEIVRVGREGRALLTSPSPLQQKQQSWHVLLLLSQPLRHLLASPPRRCCNLPGHRGPVIMRCQTIARDNESGGVVALEAALRAERKAQIQPPPPPLQQQQQQLLLLLLLLLPLLLLQLLLLLVAVGRGCKVATQFRQLGQPPHHHPSPLDVSACHATR